MVSPQKLEFSFRSAAEAVCITTDQTYGRTNERASELELELDTRLSVMGSERASEVEGHVYLIFFW